MVLLTVHFGAIMDNVTTVNTPTHVESFKYKFYTAEQVSVNNRVSTQELKKVECERTSSFRKWAQREVVVYGQKRRSI